jgi:eukaryotic-like serine/threonine-protein kinase
MEANSSRHRLVRFGVFEVDLRTLELRKHGVRIHLEDQPFHILTLLLQHPGELVTREQLREQLWPEGTFVDFDRSLNKAISKLRLALGDSAEIPRFVETLHRRGYRFISPIQVEELPLQFLHSPPPPPVQVAQGVLSGSGNGIDRVTRFRIQAWHAALAASILLVLAGVTRYLQSRPVSATGGAVNAAVPRRSVAVLGFRNLSGRDDQAWISTALSDWLTTDLSAGEQLRTIPAENVARMKIELSLPETDRLGRDSLNRIGNNLGTDLVVLGSFASFGKEPAGSIRLDLRLQDTRTGETIDAVSESGTESRLSELVSEAGEHLRTKLGLDTVTRMEAAQVAVALPSNHDAARLYSEGLEKLRVFDAQTACDLFAKSIVAEPDFALSHAALATAWATLGYDEKAKYEAKQAFELSNALPRAERLLVQGRYHEMSKDWDKAIDIYRALFAFFPDSLDYGLALAHAEVNGGRGKDALETIFALRSLPAPLRDDPRIDLAEASASESLSDFKRDLAATIQAAEKAKGLGASLLLAQAKADEAWALDNLGPLDEAEKNAQQSKELFAAAHDRRGEAQAATVRAIALGMQGENLKAKNIYEESLRIYRELGDKNGVAVELNNVADRLLILGHPIEARRNFEGSLAIYQEIGHQDGIAMAKSNLGGVLLILGDRDGAKQLYTESLDICRRIGDRSKAAGNLAGLGSVTRAGGDVELAAKYDKDAISEFEQIGDKSSAAEVEAELAALLLDQGRASEAEGLAKKAVDEFRKEKSPRDDTLASVVLARALLDQGKVNEARLVAEYALTLSQKYQQRDAELAAWVTAARVHAAAGTLNERENVHTQLSHIVADAERSGFVNYALEARLALGEIDISSGNVPTARRELEALQKDANQIGYSLVARQAASALKRVSSQ